MNKTWVPVVAGILDLTSGALQLFFILLLLMGALSGGDASAFTAELAVLYTPLVATVILAITGGFFILKRKRWGLSLAGAIAASFPFVVPLWAFSEFLELTPIWAVPALLGLAPIILTVLSRKQFERK